MKGVNENVGKPKVKDIMRVDLMNDTIDFIASNAHGDGLGGLI